ncbi:MAG: hypothetical protein HYW23_03905 [Candidatus Aenigmarchaeota archaeon]|nr:hypothetical protein [Candidatus Aenigmarchaeota archaeon]
MKAQAYIEQLFSIMMAGVVVLTFSLIIPSQATKIMPEVEQEELEGRAINLANIIMSHPSLVYSDGVTYYRGDFDANKLDSNPSIDLFYPGSFSKVTIKDSVTGKEWSFKLIDKKSDSATAFSNCFERTQDISQCNPNMFSTIMSKGFPINIMYSDKADRGIITVVVVE